LIALIALGPASEPLPTDLLQAGFKWQDVLSQSGAACEGVKSSAAPAPAAPLPPPCPGRWCWPNNSIDSMIAIIKIIKHPLQTRSI